LLRPRFSPQQAFYLTIATSLAIYRAVNALFKALPPGVARPNVSIKWPNDVLVGGRKVAGILCETELGGEGWAFAVLGFGINVNLRPDQLGELRATATSLSAELDRTLDRAALVCSILGELEGLYLSLQNGQFGPIYGEWVSALETVGKRVSVRDTGGIVEGYALRVDPDGALILRLDGGGEQRILAGDVS
jgi:BirA family biotin operon repressor/biotin-[acetyl-CoA-carboxylase] ligase